jgi:hypothetical protein
MSSKKAIGMEEAAAVRTRMDGTSYDPRSDPIFYQCKVVSIPFEMDPTLREDEQLIVLSRWKDSIHTRVHALVGDGYVARYENVEDTQILIC